jgi:hypothetical protein
MSLIIAIEPDRDQAAQLKDLVRRHTAAELILADTTEHAISALGQRIPDLVLIPAFLSPEDDEALTSALRATHAAAHVQTLTIPVLGTPETPKSVPQSVLSRLLGDQPRPASPDSCDPKIFADQITEYLERVAKDRPLSGNGHGHPGSTPSLRKPKATAPPPHVTAPPTQMTAPPSPRQESRSGVKKAIPLPAASISPKPESPAADVAALEGTLAHVSSDASSSKTTGARSAAEEADALVKGLTSLMERLSAEEREEQSKGAPTTPSVKQAAPAPARTAAEPPKPVAPPPPSPLPPPAQTTKSPGNLASVSVELTDWKELKELESLEYAMPKNVLPRDEDKVDTAPPAPTPAPTPPPAAQPAPSSAAPKSSGSEWGDLMDSLKKDLGR